MKTGWTLRSLLIAGLAVTTVGCDDGEDNPSPSWSVGFSDLAATLSCTDDLDRTIDDTLEYDVLVDVRLSGVDRSAFSARLSALGPNGEALFPAVSQLVPASGRVTFGAVPLPVGEVPLKIDLYNGDEVAATAETSVSVSIDPADPNCPAAPVAELSFTAPVDGTQFAASDDLDGDLGNGLQANVVIGVTGVSTGNVALSVNGSTVAEAAVLDGAATFDAIALDVGDGGPQSHQLEASLGAASATANVDVEVGDCTLTVSPQPAGAACDLADTDPDTDGVQAELVAQSNCSTVTFTINGEDTAPVPVVANEARLMATFTEGDNIISARAETAGGVTGAIEPYSLATISEGPSISVDDLADLGPNRFNLNHVTEGTTWRFTGVATNVAEGDALALQWNPLPGGAPEGATVAADGTFSFDITPETFGCWDLTVSGTDRCLNAGESPTYNVCLDGAQTTLSIIAPADGAVVHPGLDAQPEVDGLQIAAQINIVDPRPVAELDYVVQVECTTNQLDWLARGAGVQRSAIDAGATVIIPIADGDEDGLSCRATTGDNPNAALTTPVSWQVVFEAPLFTIQSLNAPEGQAAACFTDEVPVEGTGVGLDGNQPTLTTTLSGAAGNTGPFALEALGDQAYGVTVPTAALDEGPYTVTVAGVVQGGLDVLVAPESVDIIIDRTAPTVDIASPLDGATLGAADDADGDLANCVQTPLTIDVVDATATEVCYTVVGVGQERCTDLVDGRAITPALDLLDGANSVSVQVTDCAGAQTEQLIELTTEGCPPRLVITDPADGTHIAASADLDANLDGVQIDVTVSTGLAEGTEITVAVIDGDVSAPVAVGADGTATAQVTLSAPDGQEAPIEFGLQGQNQGANAGPISTVTVRYTPPAVAIRALGDCINRGVQDASPAAGFQLAVVADALRADIGDVVTLDAQCGAINSGVEGTVGADGSVQFPPLTVPQEASCDLTAQITDRAGQTANTIAQVEIDRSVPSIEFVQPANGTVLTPADDQDRRAVAEANGIQFTPLVRVCGAADRTLNIDAQPALGGGHFEFEVGPGDCADLALPQLTFPEGNVVFTASVGDACGNLGQTVSVVDVQGGASVIVVDPDDQGTIRANIDLDEVEPGCQYTLVATTFGLAAAAEYTVCTDFPQADRPVLCNGRASALDPRGDGCQALEGNLLRCPISLSDGAHELTVVARFGDRIESAPIRVRADCSAPTVAAITIDETGDDVCVNRQERLNPDDPNSPAAVSVRFTTDGLEDGQSVQVLSTAGEAVLGSTRVANNEGEVRVNLPTGQSYNLYLSARDAAGNRLPGYAPGANGTTVVIDTAAPTPALLNLVPNGCLNGGADLDDMTPDLQFAVQIDTGREPGERLALALIADARQDVAGIDAPQHTFDPATFPEGAAGLAVTATDACGNVGSIGGFAQGGGRDDWTRPLPLSFRVDTMPPSLSVGGLQAARIYTAGDDADAEPANGFQLAVSADFDPANSIEPGSEVRFFSGNNRLGTNPAPLLAGEGFAHTLPASITLPPGNHGVIAQATDACGNSNNSAAVNIQVDVGGCTSTITGFEDDAVLGPADGVAANGALQTTITGRINLLDPNCANARVSLLVDGVDVGEQGVGGDGSVQFDAVALTEGERTLALRVSLAGDTSDSVVQPVQVDLTAPSITIESPAGNPALVLDDADEGTAGQQALMAARVVEATIVSARTARITVDGVPEGELAVDDGSPALVNLTVTLTPGEHVVVLCITDAAGNEGCAQKTVNADPAVPGDVAAVVDITDARAPSVDFTFTAPGDDGDAGALHHYEVRRADAAIADEAAWDAASIVAVDLAADAAPGTEETLTITALELNVSHHVAIRAVDEVGRMGALASVPVDLLLRRAVFNIPARAGGWNEDAVLTDTGILKNIGDVDGDGFDDLLVALSQAPTPASQAAILYGRIDPENADANDLQVLDVPATVNAAYFGLSSGALGDINGDGAPDFAVVGYAPNFPADLTSMVIVYLGCPPADMACDRAAVSAPETTIQTGRLAYGVAGIGNFNQRAVDGGEIFGDILIGGSVFADSSNAYLIAGRANWPAVIVASDLNLGEGRTELTVPPDLVNGGTTGRQITYVGDLDGDGFDDVLFGDGTDYSHSFVYYGGADLPLSYGIDSDIRNSELAHPCRASGTTFGSFYAGGADLNGDPDGRPDILVGDYQGKRVVGFDQNLDPMDCFGRSEVQFGVNFDLAGDFDGDGDIDVVVNHGDDQGRAQDAMILYNDGAGRFGAGDGITPRGPQVRLRTPDRVKQSVAGVGDFNGDQIADVAVGSVVPGELQVVIYY
jgi:hypothetical protein